MKASYPRHSVAAALLIAGLFVVLTVPLAFWPLQAVLIGTVSRALYALLSLGLACDLAELILSFAWQPVHTPQVAFTPERSTTAVVMTVCDDSAKYFLERLAPLSDAGYDVFVLDDSDTPCKFPSILVGNAVQVRREGRHGAKAGNLNNWLRLYGDRYEHCIVLDADSVISPDACDTLLRAALHPHNADVAVFQSKLIPEQDRTTTLFTKLIAAGARPRARIFERVHARLNLILSFGHNQLLKLGPVRDVGGFDEGLTSEDTVLSLALASCGYRSTLVDVWSHDTDPESIDIYIRRTTRWARQTVELFSHDWSGAPLRLKLLLCRHLLSYLLPLAGMILLGLSLWTGPQSGSEVIHFLAAALSLEQGNWLYGLALWPMIVAFVSLVLLRIAVARAEGVSGNLLVQSWLLGSAPYFLLMVPLLFSLLASALGYKVRFVPTNSCSRPPSRSKTMQRIGRSLGTYLIFLLLISGAFYRPGSLLVGFNFVWFVLVLLSPISLAILTCSGKREQPLEQAPCDQRIVPSSVRVIRDRPAPSANQDLEGKA